MKNTFADNMAFLKVDKPPEPYKHSGQFLKQEIAEDILSRWTSSPYLPISNWIANVCAYHEKRGGIPVSNGIPATQERWSPNAAD